MTADTRRQFEHVWAEVARVYALMLAPKTLRIVKTLAWTVYLQGRTDELAKQLSAEQAAMVARRTREETQ